MFGLFKKKTDKNPKLPQLHDLEGNSLNIGDRVHALRYQLGECELRLHNDSYVYYSFEKKENVSWLKMIDASTERQKVRKIIKN